MQEYLFNVKVLIEKGQVMVEYDSGYRESIETSVRRAVLTSVNQASGRMGVINAKKLNVEYVIVSSHFGARMNDRNPIANHYGWHAKVYKIDGKTKKYANLKEATGFDYIGKDSDPLGLCGYNCRHSIFSYWLGDSNPFKKKYK